MVNTNIVPQGLFGPGILYVRRTDIVNATPVNVGYCNEFSLDFAFETKQLFGQKQFPLLAARGTAKATGKIKAAAMSGQALNTILLGGNWTSGTEWDIASSPSTAIPTTPFQITPTVPNSGTYADDLGVINAANSKPFTLVASAPTAGQYSHTAGVYTFATADNVSGISVIITYAYNWTTNSVGMNQVIANNDIGNTPTFELTYKTTLYGATYFIRLYQCIGSKESLQHKITDFAMPEYDFEFFGNSANQIGLISLATQG